MHHSIITPLSYILSIYLNNLFLNFPLTLGGDLKDHV